MPLDLVGPLKYLKASLEMSSIQQFQAKVLKKVDLSAISLSSPQRSFSASRALANCLTVGLETALWGNFSHPKQHKVD